MTRKRRRLLVLLAALASLGVATALVLAAFNDSLVFFYSPSELTTRAAAAGERQVRLGGLVEAGSVSRGAGGALAFRVTDGATSIKVAYTGIVPDLFREGQGVIAEGRLGPDGVFEARTILAKHDETYMPREVADALRKSGHWRDGEPAPARAP